MSRIAILYPGGLGAALGRTIADAGGTAITCLSGRSEATRDRAIAADFLVLPSLEDVARQSDLVISLVPPTSAVEVARGFAACTNRDRGNRPAVTGPTFVDGNSVSPHTKQHIAEILCAAGARFLDAAFFGPANQIGRDNLLALSGPCADQAASLLQEIVEVRVVGERIGQASGLKMTLAIMTKALPALFLEVVCVAATAGQLDTTLEVMRRLYPGIIGFLERTLPTYPAHVGRRVHELEEVTEWLDELGQCGFMSRSAVAVLERLRLAGLQPLANWRFDDLLRQIAETKLLSATLSPTGTGRSVISA
jgi:L-threonate 2-dehydrogenase